MKDNSIQHDSQLIAVLREGIGVVQMVLFKELREFFTEKYPDKDITFRSMLIGAVINQLFGTINPEDKFTAFNRDNRALIEQELIGFAKQFPELRPCITDALRVQALCDSQTGEDSTAPLVHADELGILIKTREIPLPSIFMTLTRQLGEKHGLTIAPVQITPEQDNLVH